MAEYGLTDAGLVVKTFAVIIEEKRQEIRALFGDSSNVDPESVFGQLINISAERENLLWELMEQIFLAQYPSTAFKGALDQAVSLNGITRDGIIFSTISEQGFWGTPGTPVIEGTNMSVDGDPDSVYVLNDTVTLGAGVNQIQKITFSVAPISGTWQVSFRGETSPTILTATATSVNVKDALELITTIDSVTVSGNTTIGFDITFDGTLVEFRKNPLIVIENEVLFNGLTNVVVSVVITTSGEYQALGQMTATVGGSVPKAPAETLTVFENTVSGITRSFNEQAATKGADKETDPALKNRRIEGLAAFGGGTADAIRTKVLDIDEISSCLVYENDTANTDSFGRPASSIEVYVLQKTEIGGGSPSSVTDQLIGEAISKDKSAGIQTLGTVPINVTDTAGFTKVVNFSRPLGIDIYLIWELTVDAGLFPVDGATLIGNAVVAYGNELGQGQDVVVFPYLMDVLGTYEGMIDVVTKIGSAPSPTLDNNVVVDDGTNGQVEISVWEAANISFVINGDTYGYNPTTAEWVI